MLETVIKCRCGRVELAVSGDPILTVACHCDDCQAGGAHLQSLPGAWPIMDEAGGTWYALYRKDRLRVLRGADLLQPWKLGATATSRVHTTCCNSSLFVRFDRGPHWVSLYRPGFGDTAPPLQMRVNTRYASGPVPDDVPSFRSFPLSFVWRLIKARVAMLLG